MRCRALPPCVAGGGAPHVQDVRDRPKRGRSGRADTACWTFRHRAAGDDAADERGRPEREGTRRILWSPSGDDARTAGHCRPHAGAWQARSRSPDRHSRAGRTRHQPVGLLPVAEGLARAPQLSAPSALPPRQGGRKAAVRCMCMRALGHPRAWHSGRRVATKN